MADLKFDVLVVGGGAAGVTAALAAARSGVSVCLMDIKPFVGGNAVSGLAIHTYVTRFGKQVVYGLAQEYIDRLIADGGAVGHLRWGGRFHTVTPVDADRFRVLITRMLDEAGVTVLYQVPAVGVKVSNGRVHGVEVAMKGGVGTIEADVIIDSSGDADVAALAGAEFRKGDAGPDGHMQPVSMVLRCYGTDGTRAADAIAPGAPRAMAKRPDYDKPFPAFFNGAFSPWNDIIRERGLFPHDDHRATFNAVWPDELNINTSFLVGVDGTDTQSLGSATVRLTEQVANIGRFLRDCVPGFERARFIPAAFVGVRETRNVRGLYEISDDDAIAGRKQPDSTIGQGCFPVDIHDPHTGRAHFTEIGDDGAFDIPYGALVAAKLDNVLVAGRCISASYAANGSTRNMCACMVTGEAAGIAAAIAVERKQAAGEIDVGSLQTQLLDRGAYLG